jgi:hypothetical protein
VPLNGILKKGSMKKDKDMIVIAPKGMRQDLAVKLVNDDRFAHMWLCHGGNTECKDGCSVSGDPSKVRQYQGITVYYTGAEIRAYKLGYHDAIKDRPSLCWKTATGRIEWRWNNDQTSFEEIDPQAYCYGWEAGMKKISKVFSGK